MFHVIILFYSNFRPKLGKSDSVPLNPEEVRILRQTFTAERKKEEEIKKWKEQCDFKLFQYELKIK